MRFDHIALSLALSLSLVCQAAQKDPAISVEDFSGLSGLQQYLKANLSPELKIAIVQSKLAVWAITDSVTPDSGIKNYCFASVGLTYSAPKSRHARRPAGLYSSFSWVTKTAWNNDECRAKALRSAVATLSLSASGLSSRCAFE